MSSCSSESLCLSILIDEIACISARLVMTPSTTVSAYVAALTKGIGVNQIQLLPTIVHAYLEKYPDSVEMMLSDLNISNPGSDKWYG